MIAAQPMMANPANVNWDDVTATVTRVINLLEAIGPTAISLAKTAMLGIKAATGRDMLGVFVALNEAAEDVQKIVAEIKAEFDL